MGRPRKIRPEAEIASDNIFSESKDTKMEAEFETGDVSVAVEKNSNNDSPANARTHSLNVIDVDKDLMFLNHKASVRASDLEDSFRSKEDRHQVFVGGTIEYDIAYGASHIRRTMSRPKTLQDVNPHLVYGWASIDDLRRNPVFSEGWAPVKIDNEGGAGAPSKVFNADGFLKDGDQYHVYTTRKNYDLATRDSMEKRDARITGVTQRNVGDHHRDLSQSVEILPD